LHCAWEEGSLVGRRASQAACAGSRPREVAVAVDAAAAGAAADAVVADADAAAALAAAAGDAAAGDAAAVRRFVAGTVQTTAEMRRFAAVEGEGAGVAAGHQAVRARTNASPQRRGRCGSSARTASRLVWCRCGAR
jgi:hypothetical protein